MNALKRLTYKHAKSYCRDILYKNFIISFKISHYEAYKKCHDLSIFSVVKSISIFPKIKHPWNPMRPHL